MDANNDKKTDMDFEQALQHLETLVSSIEKGDIALEESLQLFEKGMVLARQCETTLKAAEQKVQILMERDKAQRLVPFEETEQNTPSAPGKPATGRE